MREARDNDSEIDVPAYLFMATQIILALHNLSLFGTAMINYWRDIINTAGRKMTGYRHGQLAFNRAIVSLVQLLLYILYNILAILGRGILCCGCFY